MDIEVIEVVSRSRSPPLERPHEKDGQQRRDADAEDQERQLLGLPLALALTLEEARFGVRGVHDDASLPQSAARGNGPTVDGTGVTCLKFANPDSLVRHPRAYDQNRTAEAAVGTRAKSKAPLLAKDARNGAPARL